MVEKRCSLRDAPQVEPSLTEPASRAAAGSGGLLHRFPPTRYQGSKRKLLPFLHHVFSSLPAGGTVLDAFGGTGAVSFLLRTQGRVVTYNDLLAANSTMARALLGPPDSKAGLDGAGLLELTQAQPGRRYDDLISREYRGIYYTDEENRTLDLLAQNLPLLLDPLQHARAFYAVAQSCLIKRPYNLFHRANLTLRTADVRRSFGNKTSWERPFDELLPRFLLEAQRVAHLQAALPPVQVRCGDVLQLTGSFDMVYLDPPYVPGRGPATDYGDLYHFLDGLLDYAGWAGRIDDGRRHRPYRTAASAWARRKLALTSLEAVAERFAGAVLVVSYRSDGSPSPEEILALLRRLRRRVRVHDAGAYRYALSTNPRSRELVFVGE